MARVGFSEWVAAGMAISEGHLLRYGGKHNRVDRFESRLSALTGAKYVLAVDHGTGALVAALAAAGVGPGDEVLVPAYTWMSTPAAPVAVGAVPVLVEIDETLTMDPKDLERKITPYTKAIIPVHMVNTPADMTAIMAIARKHNLLVIEDSCQAVGVTYKGKFLGAIGDAGAFSFNKYKNLNIGEGGAVLTSSEKIYARTRNFHDLGSFVRNHAETFNEPTFIGSNMRITEIEGAMLNVQLTKLMPLMRRLRERRKALEPIFNAGEGFRISPHNDVDSAVTLTLLFDRESDAIAFSNQRGVARLLDNSKHVYTNWEPLLSKRTYHPKFNPWAWANREINYSDDMCPRTLNIISRTCVVNLGPQYPVAAMKVLASKMVSGRWPWQGASKPARPAAEDKRYASTNAQSASTR
ncbi:aminotransferase class I/II-fold pyridoxal phosphate-dependent enzyme [bacterium]|nr:aminotransferase class I/II-fold pyridoxal phosphate-dependent enzyme [bacterium]